MENVRESEKVVVLKDTSINSFCLGIVWIGNYQDPIDEGSDAGWKQCSNGEAATFTDWSRRARGRLQLLFR